MKITLKDEIGHFTSIFYTPFLTWLKFCRVHVYKNVLTVFKIRENGGKEGLAFRGGLNEYICLISTFIVLLTQVQRKVSANITYQDL